MNTRKTHTFYIATNNCMTRMLLFYLHFYPTKAIMNAMDLPSLAVICGSCTAGAAYVPVRAMGRHIIFGRDPAAFQWTDWLAALTGLLDLLFWAV